jgi:predicted dehydrogenase
MFVNLYRAAVIGCGKPIDTHPGVAAGYRIAYSHGAGYQRTGRAHLVAAADIVAENAKAYAEHFHVPNVYTDYKEMLKQEKPDLVSICTWPIYHAQMVRDAAEAGVRGILCEKPMAMNMREVRGMLEACRKHGVVLLVSHQRRYHPLHQFVRQAIADGRIGQVTRLEAWVGGGWDMMSWGTHWVDMLRFYLGDPKIKSVAAHAEWTKRQTRYGHPVEDEMVMQMVFENGELGYVHLSNEAPEVPGTLVTGTEGMIETREDGYVRLINQEGMAMPQLDLHDGFINSYRDILLDLMNSVETGTPALCSADRAAVVTEAIMAAYESAVTRRRIELPLAADDFPLTRVFAESGGGTSS